MSPSGCMWSPWICFVTLLLFLEGNNCDDPGAGTEIVKRRSKENDILASIFSFNPPPKLKKIVSDEEKKLDKSALERLGRATLAMFREESGKYLTRISLKWKNMVRNILNLDDYLQS